MKTLFEKQWESIVGNCDELLYLGGNEQSTHEYISKLLGKSTIDKKSSGETRGRQGSSSRNYDVLGREIMMPDEVRKMDNKKCLIFIRGFDPIMDNKFIPFNHPMFNQTADGKGKPYVHQIRGADNLIGPPFEILSDKAVKYYEKLKEIFPEEDYVSRYQKRYGIRYKCTSPRAAALWEVFTQECSKFGILYEMKHIVRAYKRGYECTQLSLFDNI